MDKNLLNTTVMGTLSQIYNCWKAWFVKKYHIAEEDINDQLFQDNFYNVKPEEALSQEPLKFYGEKGQEVPMEYKHLKCHKQKHFFNIYMISKVWYQYQDCNGRHICEKTEETQKVMKDVVMQTSVENIPVIVIWGGFVFVPMDVNYDNLFYDINYYWYNLVDDKSWLCLGGNKFKPFKVGLWNNTFFKVAGINSNGKKIRPVIVCEKCFTSHQDKKVCPAKKQNFGMLQNSIFENDCKSMSEDKYDVHPNDFLIGEARQLQEYNSKLDYLDELEQYHKKMLKKSANAIVKRLDFYLDHYEKEIEWALDEKKRIQQEIAEYHESKQSFKQSYYIPDCYLEGLEQPVYDNITDDEQTSDEEEEKDEDNLLGPLPGEQQPEKKKKKKPKKKSKKQKEFEQDIFPPLNGESRKLELDLKTIGRQLADFKQKQQKSNTPANVVKPQKSVPKAYQQPAVNSKGKPTFQINNKVVKPQQMQWQVPNKEQMKQLKKDQKMKRLNQSNLQNVIEFKPSVISAEQWIQYDNDDDNLLSVIQEQQQQAYSLNDTFQEQKPQGSQQQTQEVELSYTLTQNPIPQENVFVPPPEQEEPQEGQQNASQQSQQNQSSVNNGPINGNNSTNLQNGNNTGASAGSNNGSRGAPGAGG